jgi:hypothetical protein
MSQGSTTLPTTGPLDPHFFAGDVNTALAAIISQFSGTSAPSGSVGGQMFVNTSVSTAWTLSIYDGTTYVLIGTINPSTHTFTPNLAGWAASLPTTMPATVGSLWNDGGYIAIVQP